MSCNTQDMSEIFFFKAKLTRPPLEFASLWGISLNYDSGYLETLLFNPV